MRILFMGTPDFAVPSLQALLDNQYNVVAVATQPDRPRGRKQELTPSPVKILAEKYNLPILQPEKISSAEEIVRFKKLYIDLIITAAFGQILSKDLLQIPKLGCINIHASLLPKYRGGAPIHWSVINGESETGVTIMFMVEKLDAGAMIRQRKVPILPTDTTGIVYEKVTNVGAELLIDTLPDLITGNIKPIEQDETEATYAPNIRREDERIDWNHSASRIYNQIRGLAPWPGAYTTLAGTIVKIWSCEMYEQDSILEVEQNVAGSIIKVTKKGPIILTGEGCLLLKEIQPASKKRMLANNYTNSGKITVGTRLGI